MQYCSKVSNNPSGLASLDFVNPPADGDALRNGLTGLEELDILLDGLLELREGQEVRAVLSEFLHCFGSMFVYQPTLVSTLDL